MPTLAGTFKYPGQAPDSPVQMLRITASIPRFEHEVSGASNRYERRQIGESSVTTTHALADSLYGVEIPSDVLLGSTPSSAYDFYRYHFVQALSADSLAPYSIPITVVMSSSDEANISFAKVHFDALYAVSVADTDLRGAIDQPPVAINRLVSTHRLDAPSAASIRQRMLTGGFLVNAQAFERLRDGVGEAAVANKASPLYLLQLVAKLVAVENGTPRIRNDLGGARDALVRSLREAEVEDPEAVVDLVSKSLNELLDFPIEAPKLTAVEVRGRLSSSSEEPLTAKDLRFYDLVAEYTDQANLPRILRHEWPLSPPALTDGAAAFDLSAGVALVPQAVSGQLVVLAKGYDGSVLWRESYSPDDPALANLDVRVPKYLPASLSSDGVGPAVGAGNRLRGKVVYLGGDRSIQGLTVVIQARSGDGDGPWKIVGAAETDGSGNFSLPHPAGRYHRAQALVSLAPDQPAELVIDSEAPADGPISTDFIYLLLREEDIREPRVSSSDKDCGCDAKPVKAKRLPDQTDLINSDEYTQDIGGACVNLSTPNRTLREYSYNAIVRTSDPDVANYTLHKTLDDAGRTTYGLQGGASKIHRASVDLDNPIRWQDAPDANAEVSLYQAVTVATGHVLHFKSVMKADGYSLGDLLYSLPLGPGQKKHIVVFESAHSLRGAESQTLTQDERLSAELISDRIITDQLSGGIDESLSGQSDASTAGISAGLGVSASYGGIGGSLGVAGGYSNSNSSASQNGSRAISQFFSEKLRQSLTQNAAGYRALNASVVTTVTEGQNYGVRSEVVANHNHCHSLTMMYFEVLRHYAIFQELSHVEECVFVPLLMTHFSTENVYKWKDVLATRLLPIPSSTYLQPSGKPLRGARHPLLKGFDAIERIKTNYERVDYPPAPPAPGHRYGDGVMDLVEGIMTLRVDLKRPKTRYDRIKSLPMVKVTTSSEELDPEATVKKNAMLAAIPFGFLAMGSATRTVTEEAIVVGQIFDQFMQLDANYASVPPAKCIRVVTFKQRTITLPDGTPRGTTDEFFEDGTNDKNLWTAYAALLGKPDVYDFLEYYFAGRLISEWDDIFYNDLIPEVMRKIVDENLFSTPLRFDATLLDTYKGGARNVRVRLRAVSTGRVRSDLPESLQITTTPQVAALNTGSVTLRVEHVELNYSTDHFHGTLHNRSVGDDLYDGVSLFIPLTTADKRSPRTEDALIANQLIEHLNSNIEYYNKVLWRTLDRDRRLMLLDGFSIEVFDGRGDPLPPRSLASVVKNDLVTVVGNSLVLPVADGYKVFRGYLTEVDGEVSTPTLLDHYKPLTPIPPYRLSVPSRGVFMEAVQGACDACEMVKENSSQDWDRFRTDEPTAISPVVTPTPTISTYRPEYKDFAAPLINLQNAPSAPAPGVGLSQLGELLGKAGVFNDVTGLQGNQRNVLETYLSNQENAKAFAEMSKSLASQQHNSANSSSFMRTASEARAQGAITDDDYRDLTRQHLQQQIDGGELAREQAQLEREQARPSLTEPVVEAIRQGTAVRAERSDSDGTREMVDVQSRTAEPTVAPVRYDVPALQQPPDLSRSCWAVVATMMVAWRERVSRTIESVLEEAGQNLTPPQPTHYLARYRNNTGLAASEKLQFLGALGMAAEPPASYGPTRYLTWLTDHGPLWITSDDALGAGFSPHARLLVAMRPQGSSWSLTFIDPARGAEETEPFEAFVEHFEELIRQTSPSAPTLLQVVHFTATNEPTEGQEAPDGDFLTGPLSDEEWGEVDLWQSRGRVSGLAPLTADAESNALAVAGHIFCSRYFMVDDGTGDPLLCVDPEVTGADPRVRSLATAVTERSPIINWTTVPRDDRIRRVMELLVERYGFPVAGAAGIVGNLMHESGVLPTRIEFTEPRIESPATPLTERDAAGHIRDFTADEVMRRGPGVGPAEPGIGLAQWTGEGRRAGLFTHAYEGRVLGPAILFSLEAQVDYLVSELQQAPYTAVYNMAHAPGANLEAVADEFVYKYEVPGRVLQDVPPPRPRRPRGDPQVQAVFERRRANAREAAELYAP